MRSRTFLLVIVALLIVAILVIGFVFINQSGGVANLLSGGGDEVTTETPTVQDGESGEVEPGIPVPTATPQFRLVRVVVAKTNLPVGERIRPDLVEVEERPDDNIAIIGQVTFTDTLPLIGQITTVDISQGQAILTGMVTDIPNNVEDLGSDLALYVEEGKVAVAFPIDKFSGLAYAMRPGDLVDVLMTLRVIETDPEFNTALPNVTRRVIESELLAGRAFLFPKTLQGRLEFIPEISQVVEFIPNKDIPDTDTSVSVSEFEFGLPIPKRVTQLTIQQAEVLWVGTWEDPREQAEEEAAQAAAGQFGGVAGVAVEETAVEEGDSVDGEPEAAETEEGGEIPERSERQPDVIILSMTAQDALALKFALERGIDIDLALRAQNDLTPFITVSVSLPQIIDQGGLVVPEPSDFDLDPRAEEVPAPSIPAVPPEG